MVIGAVICGGRTAVDGFKPSCPRCRRRRRWIDTNLVGLANKRSSCARHSVEPNNVLMHRLPVIILLSIPIDNVCVCASDLPVVPRVVPLFLSEVALVVIFVSVGGIVPCCGIWVKLGLVELVGHRFQALIDIVEVFETLLLKHVEFVLPLPEVVPDSFLVVVLEFEPSVAIEGFHLGLLRAIYKVIKERREHAGDKEHANGEADDLGFVDLGLFANVRLDLFRLELEPLEE